MPSHPQQNRVSDEDANVVNVKIVLLLAFHPPNVRSQPALCRFIHGRSKRGVEKIPVYRKQLVTRYFIRKAFWVFSRKFSEFGSVYFSKQTFSHYSRSLSMLPKEFLTYKGIFQDDNNPKIPQQFSIISNRGQGCIRNHITVFRTSTNAPIRFYYPFRRKQHIYYQSHTKLSYKILTYS